jgi:hypothetical protein
VEKEGEDEEEQQEKHQLPRYLFEEVHSIDGYTKDIPYYGKFWCYV